LGGSVFEGSCGIGADAGFVFAVEIQCAFLYEMTVDYVGPDFAFGRSGFEASVIVIDYVWERGVLGFGQMAVSRIFPVTVWALDWGDETLSVLSMIRSNFERMRSVLQIEIQPRGDLFDFLFTDRPNQVWFLNRIRVPRADVQTFNTRQVERLCSAPVQSQIFRFFMAGDLALSRPIIFRHPSVSQP
jgi:hypothetical protein